MDHDKSTVIRSTDPILMPATFSDMMTVADVLVKSGFLPESVKTPAQAAAIMIAGRELGFSVMQSFRCIYIVKGKPAMSAQSMGAKIKAAGHYYHVDELSNERCQITFRRTGSPAPYTHTFTMDDAKAAGLAGSDTWRKYPKAMLYSRCMSAGARIEMPDVIEGMYTPEELADPDTLTVDESTGEIIEGTDHTVPQVAPAPTPTPTPATTNGNGKNARWIARIMVLCGRVNDLTNGRRYNEFHLPNHLQKHYGVASLSEMTDAQMTEFGKALNAEIAAEEARIAAQESAPAPDDEKDEAA